MKAHRLLTLPLALFTLGLACHVNAHAQSLTAVYEAARNYDAGFQSARAQYEANLAKADQSRAAILPTANLAAGVSRSDFESNNPVVNRSYDTRNASISATQPLYRPGSWASYEQGQKFALIALAQLQAAEQDLIVRVSQAYFDVLSSQDSLTFVRAQKAAVAEQLAAAQRNFEVGTATITDTREAQARYDLVLAQEIAAENDLSVKKIALDQLVGTPGTVPWGLAVPVKLPALNASEISSWVEQAEADHPTVRQAELGVQSAQLESDKARAGHKPTLDALASYGVTRSDGSAASSLTSRSTSTSVGLSFNLPLFAGFATQNRLRETLSLEDKARSDLDAARRNVSQATRTAFLGVLSGLGQVKALEAAEASSQSALDANKLGYQVGVRINIDVLNSQSQLYQTKRDLAQARYSVMLGNLKLRQAAGTLKAEDLAALTALLQK